MLATENKGAHMIYFSFAFMLAMLGLLLYAYRAYRGPIRIRKKDCNAEWGSINPMKDFWPSDR